MLGTLLSLFLVSCICSASIAGTVLADAAEAQDWPRVQRLLLAEVPSATQPDGMTALHWATYHGDKSTVTRLLVADADPNAKTRYAVTPLSIACEAGRAAITKQLLLAGADPNQRLPGAITPLMLAARSGDAATVRELLHHGAKIHSAEGRRQTALMFAAAAGAGNVVDVLVASGADIEATSRSGFTALMFAARDGRGAAMKRLLAAGAKPGAVITKGGGGRAPRKGTSALLMAVESGHYQLALELVRHGADPNDQRSGYAPLHALSWARRPQYGDNPKGDPPPRGSGSVAPLRFVRELVAAGADVNLRLKKGGAGKADLNPRGATPFLLASHTADLPLMQTLLDLGADPTITNADGTTPLITAAGVGSISVGEHPGSIEEVEAALRLLIDLGADVNAVDKNHQTAMHGAAYRSYPETVALLAELGANPAVWNVKNHHKSTPIDVAKGRRPGSLKPSPETVAALRAAMGKPSN